MTEPRPNTGPLKGIRVLELTSAMARVSTAALRISTLPSGSPATASVRDGERHLFRTVHRCQPDAVNTIGD